MSPVDLMLALMRRLFDAAAGMLIWAGALYTYISCCRPDHEAAALAILALLAAELVDYARRVCAER